MTEKEENKICRNCQHPMTDSDLFCTQCGQKYTTGKITLKSIISTFFSELFSIDSRIYRSIIALFVPGKLTIEYFKGRHKSFAPPLRVFIMSSLLLITSASAFMNKSTVFSTNYKNLAKLNKNKVLVEVDSIQAGLKTHFDDPTVSLALDSLRSALAREQPDRDELLLMRFAFPFQLVTDKSIDRADAYYMDEEDLFEKYDVESENDRWFARQQIKVVKDTKSYQAFVLGRITLITLLLMPAVALILKLLYYRRKRYYAEHFIFSMHYHSFAFLLISLLLLILLKIPVNGAIVFGLLISVGLVYLFVAMKQVYQQSVWKTLVKFCILNFSYLVFLSFFLTSAVMLSFLLF